MNLQNACLILKRDSLFKLIFAGVLAIGLWLPPTMFAQPANDNWENSINLGTTFPFTTTGTNVDSTTQPGEQNLGGGGFLVGTVWWYFTASDDGVVTIDLNGSDFETILDIYTGFEFGFENLLHITRDIGTPFTTQSKVSFEVVAGDCYEIRVGGRLGDEGNIVLNGQFFADAVSDNFANTINLGEFPIRECGFNFTATTEPGEQQLDETGATVWYYFLAPNDGYVRLSTIFSFEVKTNLHIYAGFEAGLENLIPVINSVQDSAGFEYVHFPVVAGEFYEVRVGGLNGDVGQFVLKGDFFPTPFNDFFVLAFPVKFPFNVPGYNFGTTTEAGEEDLDITDKTVWWFYNLPRGGTVTIDTFGSDFDTVMHLYEVDFFGPGPPAIEDLVLVAENDQAGGTDQSAITFHASEPAPYVVRVGGFFGAEGNIELNGVFTPDIIPGDVNMDGVVNLLDVQPFVDLLISGEYQAEADINMDGVVDLLDVGPFVEVLSG